MIELLWPLGVVGGVAGIFAMEQLAAARERVREWRDAARAAGFGEDTLRRRWGFPTSLRARRGPLELRLSSHRFFGVAEGTLVAIGGLCEPLTLRRAGAFGSVRGLTTGDESFDLAIAADGDPVLARAVLDADTRRLVVEALTVRLPAKRGEDLMAAPEVWLRSGELRRVCFQPELARQPLGLAESVRDLAALAERLAPPTDVAARLAANAAFDPVAEVRLASLEILRETYGGHPATRDALRRALADGDERVQLLAALETGAEGRTVLLDIVRREWSADACAARAVAGLRGQLPGADAEHALDRALRGGRNATVAACLDSLARRGDAHVPAVSRVLAVERGSRAIAAARALGRSRAVGAEHPLLAALGHADSDVRVEAAAALGRVGSAGAVPALREAADAGAPAALVAAAHAAIASIQSRLSGADRGQLALSPDGGAVSLTDDASGRVTIEDAS